MIRQMLKRFSQLRKRIAHLAAETRLNKEEIDQMNKVLEILSINRALMGC